MPMPEAISDLLRSWGRGDLQARDSLFPLVYRELRRRATAYLRHERPNHTLQPTALVHEAYLRLAGQDRITWQSRAQFFGVAAQMMRRILVDHAREHQSAKRAGSSFRVALGRSDRCYVAVRLRGPAPRGRAAGTGASGSSSGTDCRVPLLRRDVRTGSRGSPLHFAINRDARMADRSRLALSAHHEDCQSDVPQ